MFTFNVNRSATLGFVALTMSMVLAACAQFDETLKAEDEAPLICPKVLILSEGSELMRFAVGPGRSNKNILHHEIFLGFDGACEIETSDSGANKLVLEISPKIASERGPANIDGMARFEYFVVLTDSAKRLVTKRRFVVNLEYGDDGRQLWIETQPAIVTIPLKPNENGDKWIVFLGLQPTRAELEYMRTKG